MRWENHTELGVEVEVLPMSASDSPPLGRLGDMPRESALPRGSIWPGQMVLAPLLCRSRMAVWGATGGPPGLLSPPNRCVLPPVPLQTEHYTVKRLSRIAQLHVRFQACVFGCKPVKSKDVPT